MAENPHFRLASVSVRSASSDAIEDDLMASEIVPTTLCFRMVSTTVAGGIESQAEVLAHALEVVVFRIDA